MRHLRTLGVTLTFSMVGAFGTAPAAAQEKVDRIIEKPITEKITPEVNDEIGYLRKRPSKVKPPEIEPDDRVGFLRKRPAKVKPDETSPQPDPRKTLTPQREH